MSNEEQDGNPANEFADASGEAQPPGTVFRVGVRVPPFWPDDPALWFAQLEGQFILSNITSDTTKFYYVTSHLDHQYVMEVKDIIKAPPVTGKYEKLKTELIKRLSASQEKKVKEILMHAELGDRKPSQFLRHLQDLADNAVPKDFLRTIWSSRLPQNIQTIIASQPDLGLEKLADLADKVYEIAPMIPQVASTSAASTSAIQNYPGGAYTTMSQQINELTKQVAALSAKFEHRSRSRSRSGSRSRYGNSRQRSRSRPRQPPPDHPHCWYHFTMGRRAKKCVQPCTWKAENPQGSRQ